MDDIKINKIPEPTLRRLTLYYQYLNSKSEQGIDQISCTDIAHDLELTSIQIRKDLQIAGAKGKPKIGYTIEELVDVLSLSLGYDNVNDAFLVGVGNFGQLLLNYNGFKEYGFNILAAFDNDKSKINKSINDIKIMDINKFDSLSRRMGIKIGIIATDSQSAQEIADLMVQAGIKAIWNLTHTNIVLPGHMICEEVHLGESLSILLSKLSKLKVLDTYSKEIKK